MRFDLYFVIKYIPMYIKAAKLTLTLAFFGIILSIIIGFICSIIVYYRVKGLKQIVGVYVEVSRNTPLLIQLFFLYYGLPQVGVKLDAITCAVVGLAFLGGSYMSEAFRGGFEAVSKTQVEAGLSIGLTKPQLIRYVIFLQAFAVAVPSLGANAIFILKETSIVSAIALADLMFVAKDLIGMYYKTTEALTMLVVAYLIILLPISLIFTTIERRVRYAGFGG
ncbi:amino acid ABC transporter permease [Clostridium cellulovorans]|uniref:Polar amino acid ABC transporter, inner membrane subunit n=1 Tax=Clostridium cellulovorans (strain ATCC 35296 / DSM 3052 / OCM 3 / 743B) TaxID=573061 RepID=D9SVT8_CLOC7|nr:polar amino acid ABC transporter, inner membrane subunit [Clostridium cellulovorans 743B]